MPLKPSVPSRCEIESLIAGPSKNKTLVGEATINLIPANLNMPLQLQLAGPDPELSKSIKDAPVER